VRERESRKMDWFEGIYDDGVRCGVNENVVTPTKFDWMDIVYCWIFLQLFPYIIKEKSYKDRDTLSYLEHLCPLGLHRIHLSNLQLIL